MRIKELNIGDKFYCLVQVEKGVYAVVERVAAGFEVNAYGEIIKYVSNGMIFAGDANYCEASFDKCVELVKKNTPGELAICSACGRVFAEGAGGEVKKIGRISICKECLANVLASEQSQEAKEEAKEKTEVEGKKKSKSDKKSSKVSNSTPLNGASEASVEGALGDSGLSGI